MSNPVSRRAVLATSGIAVAGVTLPSIPAYAHGRTPRAVKFTVNAEVLDGGEQVTSLTLDASRLGRIDQDSLGTETFSVHVDATSPVPLPDGDLVYSEDRAVTGVELDRRGRITLHLDYGEGQIAGTTLSYLGDRGRNVLLDLAYTIVQNEPIDSRHGHPIMINEFEQGRLSDPEVDAFSYEVSRSGMNYRLFSPAARAHPDHSARSEHSQRHGRKRPLIVWLHGGGEGGMMDLDYYDNETQLRANRGALGFATEEAQQIFGDAYVVAPQCTSAWMEDGPRFAPLIDEIINELARRHPIDRDRIHVVGCSNGGYMSMKMTVDYPRRFATSVPICGVVQSLSAGGPRLITDDELADISTPTWLVASRDDPTVDPIANTEHAHELIPGSVVSLYDHVIWNGYQFLGHFSWIYVARNDPRHHRTRLWQWMAAHRS